MTFDLVSFLFAIPAVVFAGISKGGFGSGAAFAGSSILALIVEPALALGIMLPLLMLIDVASLRPYWRKWSWRDARLIMLGALPGVALGVWLYRVANDDVLRFLLGFLSLAFVAFQIAKGRELIPNRQTPLHANWGLFTGGVAGFTSFVSHAGGPPVAVYLLSQGLSKTTYQATSVIVFWVINIFKFVPYAWLGIFTWDTFWADVYLAPFAVFGAWLGVLAHRLIPEAVFFKITYVLLTLTGSKLIYDALF